jgi:hypothetical protein
MFPMAETIEPPPFVGVPKDLISLAIPLIPFHNDAAPELKLELELDDTAFSGEVELLDGTGALVVGLTSAAMIGAAVGVATGAGAEVFFWPSAQAEDQSIPILLQSRESQSLTLSTN